MEILCFFAGIALVYVKPFYPTLFLLMALFFRPRVRFVLCFMVGLLWSFYHQRDVMDQHMPNAAILKRAVLQGYIASIPFKSRYKIQFQFHAISLNGQPVKSLLLLSCYDHCPNLHAGEAWKVTTKLKKAHNLSNPGGFDYVSYLESKHTIWTGYTYRGTFKRLKNLQSRYRILSLRERLSDFFEKHFPDQKILGILQALTLGITNHIDKEGWDLFRRTGTIHLMVISGAHIGLVAGLTFQLTKKLWCRMGQICLRYPAPKAASWFALCMACIYTILAGFGVPAQRALVVCFFMSLRHFCNQRFSVWQAWRYALMMVVCIEPHSVLSSGFYLSFMAVAILILVGERLEVSGIRKTLALQMACLLGLMPLTLFWFSYGAVNGMVANLLAIPWVGFVVIPTALLVMFLGHVIPVDWIVSALKMVVSVLLLYLNWVDSFEGLNLNFTFHQLMYPVILMIGMSLLLFIPLWQWRVPVIVAMLVCFYPRYERLQLNSANIDVLDVGQGLAVVIQTKHHLMLYDTGGSFYHGGDMGKLVVVPYLKTLGRNKLDAVVISHPDLDHRGGLNSVESSFRVGALWVDDPKFYHRGLSCHKIPPWNWDGVKFRFLPIRGPIKGKNNRSCVLQIETEGEKVLMTGDIESPAEAYLVQHYPDELRSRVMLVPHHGSKTSSSLPFLEKVKPQYAVLSYGFDNRYHLPHPSIVNRYQKYSIKLYDTLHCGRVRIVLTKPITKNPVCFLKENNRSFF